MNGALAKKLRSNITWPSGSGPLWRGCALPGISSSRKNVRQRLGEMNDTISRTIKPCGKCRDWSNCPGHEWYAMHEIRFCRVQVIWLVTQFFSCGKDGLELERDSWPSNVYVSGYTDAPKTSHSVNSHAGFEKPMQLVGELEHRLLKTGKDGRLLVLEVHVRNVCDTTGRELSRDARAALGYCSGWKRKRQSYNQWLAEKKRHETHKIMYFTPLV